MQFIWPVLPGASTVDIKERVQKHLNGPNPEYSDERIIFMFMFNDIEWIKKDNTENVCIMPKSWQYLRPNSSQDTGAS